MLTADQRQAGIAQISAAADAARRAIEAQSWWPWEADAKAQQLGAVRIVQDTTLRAMQSLAAEGTDAADLRLVDLAHTAEDSLAAIRGYSADASFDSVLAATAAATAQRAGELAAVPVQLAAKGLAAMWAAIPTLAKLAAGAVVGGIAWWYVRPLIPGRKKGA